MKCIIFAGGLGTRLSEKTDKIPKPMVEVGDKPLLWHIMKIYSVYGIKEFIILAGYKQHSIKEYFNNYYLHNCSATFDLYNNTVTYNQTKIENWKVTILDTGINTPTGDRLKQAKHLIKDETFLLTYGDGLSDVSITQLIEYHKLMHGMVTLTSVQPEGKYGNLILDNNNHITNYEEKPVGDNRWINGGYMVCNKQIFNNLQEGDFANTLKYLSLQNQLHAYPHKGFWKSVDTIWDLNYARKLWDDDEAKWKVWSD